MDDFDRKVVCFAGLPFDVVDMAGAVDQLSRSAVGRKPLFLSTPNLNFLMAAQRDKVFRDSVVHSDMSVVDGMPLVWMARLLGLPIRERVAGASLFEALRLGGTHPALARPISVYFFGGPPGVAETAAQVINSCGRHMICAGFHSPGFGSIEDMSAPAVIEAINASGADFLVVALGAKKGQAWIEHNRAQITVPIISHLGAVVNFVAGTVNRAPVLWQRLGMEWLWRIKEEPSLFRRYFFDALGLVHLLLVRVLPHAIWRLATKDAVRKPGKVCVISEGGVTNVALVGDLVGAAVDELRAAMRQAVSREASVIIDLSDCGYLGHEFFGLLLLLKKQLDVAGLSFELQGLSQFHKRMMFWNGMDYLPGCK